MHQACFVTGWMISQMDYMISLRFPVRPFSGLVGEAASPPFRFLPWLAQLEYPLVMILEGVPDLYTFSVISLR